MGAGVAGRRLLSHLTKASPLPDGKACDVSAKPIDCIDLESSAPRASLASQADLLTFGIGDLSAWIVEAAAPQAVFPWAALG
jgi:hypothetical protein